MASGPPGPGALRRAGRAWAHLAVGGARPAGAGTGRLRGHPLPCWLRACGWSGSSVFTWEYRSGHCGAAGTGVRGPRPPEAAFRGEASVALPTAALPAPCCCRCAAFSHLVAVSAVASRRAGGWSALSVPSGSCALPCGRPATCGRRARQLALRLHESSPLRPVGAMKDGPLGCPAALTHGVSMSAAFCQPWHRTFAGVATHGCSNYTVCTVKVQSSVPRGIAVKNELLPQSFETTLVRMNICHLDQRFPTSLMLLWESKPDGLRQG